ncbi:hypothetical protein L0B53_00080 [Vibrio sp. SS-MA-C1-2]|uniref:type VI secretion system-associated FHA domain protein n=1 Tax=Vibrio sp. SS-MA-C1-2 TaxID=2908646 RepID=UPI001F21C480|nr:type VI secretion system-associated FHA domain protein [Vibrio sp. SS-MA-C1-2]UJF17210.1 hypothetical protein L0B53_00080 [Vibrio sp. SS-MA-C1-2]
MKNFSAENVFEEDLFDYDPFESNDDYTMDDSFQQQTATKEPLLQEPEVIEIETPNRQVATKDFESNESLQQSIERLNLVIDQQQNILSSGIDHQHLMRSIEVTLDKFLMDLDPEQLEKEYNDYIVGWGNKDKKYWSLYKKQFARKVERREFYRQFTAMLLEELLIKR